MGGLFDGLPRGPMPQESVQHLFVGLGGRIERIVSYGHTTDWYDGDQDEWVVVLAGYGVLEYGDGTRRELRAGDFEFLPAHRRHRVAATASDRPTVWLAVFFSGGRGSPTG